MTRYFEPWEARPSRSDAPSGDWLIWGTDMLAPAAAAVPAGGEVVMDGHAIVVRVGTIVSDRPGAATTAQVAARIAACVNACAGIAHPGRAIADALTLFEELLGDAEVDEGRVRRLASALRRRR